jgi:cytochrome b
MVKVRIWDLPTRVFHWVLVLCVLALVITGQVGDSALDWHFRFGFVVAALLLFRVVWGFVGGRWSRFLVFVRSPFTILRYLRGQGSPDMEAGHNPLGALSVLGLLAVACVQVCSGLLSDDEITHSGPFSHLVSSDWVSIATSLHTRYNKMLLIALVVLHISAILFYRFVKRRNLVRPMLTGDKELDAAVEPATDTLVTRVTALSIFLALMCGVWWAVLRWGPA